MYWNAIPDFGDSFSTSREIKNEATGITFVEVLYGAKDSDGNACAPTSGSDGHGRWLAMESNGSYQMLLWQHPRTSGGKLELAQGMSEDPINDIVLTVRTKEAIIEEAQKIIDSDDRSVQAARTMNELMERWKAAKGWHTPREDELWEKFHLLRSKFRKAREGAREEAKAAKEALAAEAEAALEKRDFRHGSQYMRDLMQRWKQVPSAGREDDQALWERFNGARKAFFDAQHSDYVRREEERVGRVNAKESLIIRAQALTDAQDYSRGAADEMKNLTNEWKSIGGIGREQERELWTRFREAQDPFWEARKKDLDRKHQLWEERHAEWCVRMEGVIGNKERQIERISERLDVLEYQLSTATNSKRQDELAERIADNRATIQDLEDDIADIRRKMSR